MINNKRELQKFDSSKPFIIRKKFQDDGRNLVVGDEFTWDELQISERKLQKLFEAGFIRHEKGASPLQTFKQAMAERRENREGNKSVTSELFKVVKRDIGWFDVINKFGQVLNGNALRFQNADNLAKQLEKGKI